MTYPTLIFMIVALIYILAQYLAHQGIEEYYVSMLTERVKSDTDELYELIKEVDGDYKGVK